MTGVQTCALPISFNDQEDQRSGGGIWLNEQAAREIYLLPFEYALSSAEGMGNAHAVMSAMNRIGTDWVGANMNLLNNIMRDEWGFDGYCITDMAASDTGYIMNYQDGIARGTDLFLGSDVYAVLDYAAAVRRRETPGGTGPRSVARQLEQLELWLAEQEQR